MDTCRPEAGISEPFDSGSAAAGRRPLAPELRDAIREYMEQRRLSAQEPPAALVSKLDSDRPPAFRDTLLAMIRERGLVDSRVYEAAGIDRRHYSKIRNRADYRPTKTTAVSFAFALRLGIREAERLLRSAGYAFSEASDFDLICSYFIEEGEWDPAEVNDALWAYGQPLVCGATLD
jgi:hypothetical protein